MSLAGAKIAGGNPENDRVENDYYATNPKAVEMLLREYEFNGNKMLEPCVGAGHIADAVKSFYGYDDVEITGVDLVDRGCPNTIVANFLEWDNGEKYDFIISNPPYSLAQEFIKHGLDLLKDNGQMAMFLKIQFLEGQKRKFFFQDNPPRYIFVFRKRMAVWNDGQQFDPKTGKDWATTMCHAWFIWEKGYTGRPEIGWLD